MLIRSAPGLALVLALAIPSAQAFAQASQTRLPALIASQKSWPPQGPCAKKLFEWARLSLDIAADGSPQQVELVDSSKPTVNETAASLVREDRFTPAEQNGTRVAMHGILLVEMDACVDKVKLADGSKAEQYWLNASPRQTFYPSPNVFTAPPQAYRTGKRISAPVPLLAPEAHFTPLAKKNKVLGEVFVMLIVDANGMPQNPRVVKPLPAGLTEEAIAAVEKYRFKPALQGGKTPVPVMITIAVNFRLY
jgi:TonB family protein